MLESLDKNDPAKAEALKQSTHVDSVLKASYHFGLYG
jgi:hypothetical protein